MSASKMITIALCFNDKDEAIRLSEKLKIIAPFINFAISVNFNDLLDVIGKEDNIDCFIIEEKYKEYASEDLIRLLKKSQRYQKSIFSLFLADLETMDKKYLELQINYKFDLATDMNEVANSIKQSIEKNAMPVIPTNFNVMVLDDNKEFLELISMHLNELGHHKIDYFADVASAKLGLSQKEYDLLLLDWNLDDGTCIDLIEYIQNTQVGMRTKAAVKVIITGRNDVEDIMTLLDYGIKDYIIKPFDFNEFENKIDYALEKGIRKAR